ncbi:hypothetical protein CPHO_06560 [Corynebacterium phocae]|uniref:Transposase n=1 Tax=Corynebacterium phocae TaxID=161895 RepID=A0A1L7D3C6_9CORY|nr:hypothetical protein [Corynebacterium phocae]APT92610.1 hypothetical protein CPHO_06560 [Corynebacterium phocae]KAA8724166.1 hypothetical protein F4V58_06095 [Corynebacterium phocae]
MSDSNHVDGPDYEALAQEILGFEDVTIHDCLPEGEGLVMVIESNLISPQCPRCGEQAEVIDQTVVELVDTNLGCQFLKIRWFQHQLDCQNAECDQAPWIHQDPRIASPGCPLTTRAVELARDDMRKYSFTPEAIAYRLGCEADTVRRALAHFSDSPSH